MKANIIFLIFIGVALANPLIAIEDATSVDAQTSNAVLSAEKVDAHGNKTHAHHEEHRPHHHQEGKHGHRHGNVR